MVKFVNKYGKIDNGRWNRSKGFDTFEEALSKAGNPLYHKFATPKIVEVVSMLTGKTTYEIQYITVFNIPLRG